MQDAATANNRHALPATLKERHAARRARSHEGRAQVAIADATEREGVVWLDGVFSGRPVVRKTDV